MCVGVFRAIKQLLHSVEAATAPNHRAPLGHQFALYPFKSQEWVATGRSPLGLRGVKFLTREARSIWSGAARQEIFLKFIHRGERLVRLNVRAEIGRLIPTIHRTNNKSYY